MDFGGFTAVPMIPKITRGVIRRNVDYTSCVITYLEGRLWQRGKVDKPTVQPDVAYVSKMVPPVGSEEDPVTAITTKFVKTVYNKQRCPIFCTSWAPDGRRLIAGAASGEFSLWNGNNLTFEALMKSHDGSVRSMEWSHNAMWMATTDDRGVVKYWQSNMNNVHTFQAHNESIRGCSFSPTDAKLATCSDDGTVRIFDFLRSSEEFILRGHGADVKCVDWHPRKNLLVSGSKDNQQPIKLWDPKAGQSVSTIHAHKAAVTCVKWNRNGTWLLTGSRDHLIKLYDIRTMKELEVLKGHKSDVNTVSWHPVHEKLFTSGGSDGAILFWLVGNKRDIGGMESPHDSFVWSLAWHPLGHMLCSGSNDHTCKFWCRNRPGDEMKDRHSSGGLPIEEVADSEIFDGPSLPGALASNISLPPPSKKNDNISLPPPSVSTTWNAGQAVTSEKPAVSAADFPLQVLGADIIREQFGKPSGPPGPHPQNQDPPTNEPVKAGLFMHVQGGEMNTKEPPPNFDGQFRPPSNQLPASFPHQNTFPPQEMGGAPRMRAPPQNFHGSRVPPMQQNRREWPEEGGDFPGQHPHTPHSPHEFPPRRFGMRPGSHTPSPFSWQRQDRREWRPSYEEEGLWPHNEQGRNPYVYRRDDSSNKLRDPREQRVAPPPHPESGGGADISRRPSQDEHTPDWQNKGPLAWPQEHRGGPPPNQHRPGGQDSFHNRESKPSTQEHFDQQSRDIGPPRDPFGDQGSHFHSGGPPQDRRNMDHQNRPFQEGENWGPPFGRDRPPHEGPQHKFPPQGPPTQGSRFPSEQSNFPSRPPEANLSEQQRMHNSSANESNKGPPMNNPQGKIPPRPGTKQRGPGSNVHDPRSQRSQVPPPSEPRRPQGFPPNQPHPPPQHPQFPHEGPPQHFPDGPPPLREGGAPRGGGPPHHPQQIHEGPPPQHSPQIRDAPSQLREGPPPQHPPHIRDGPPHLQSRDGPGQNPPHGPLQQPGPLQNPPHGPLQQSGPLPHGHPHQPGPLQNPPHGPPQQHGPLQNPPHDPPQQPGPLPNLPPGLPQQSGPPHGPPQQPGPPQKPPHGPPQQSGPPQNAPHGPPQQPGPPLNPPHIRDGPPHFPPTSHDGPPHLPPQQRHDGPPPQFRDGPPQHPPRDAPPQHPPNVPPHMPPQAHDGPPQGREGPPHRPPNVREGPPQTHNVPPHHPPHLHNGPPQHIHEGSSQHIRDGPPQHPHHVRDGPPQPHDGPLHIPANSPQHLNAPQRFEEFHASHNERGPPQGEQFFQNQPGGQHSPHHVGSPVTSQPHQFGMPPHSRPPAPQNFNPGPPESSHGGPPPGQRFPTPHPPHMAREQEHFPSPQHFQEHQDPPPNIQGPPTQQFSGPPAHSGPHFDRFPEQHQPPHGGPPQQPSDPRRQHPPQNFQGGPLERGPQQNLPGAGDRFPPHHLHPLPPRPPQNEYNKEGLSPQSGPNWDHTQSQHHNAFPRDNRFDVNRDPHERRAGGGRGEVREGREGREGGREGRDKRDRDRDRDRDRGHRDRSPKHHRDGQPGAKRSRSERDSSKHSRREKRK